MEVQMSGMMAVLFWGFLVVYGIVMWALSPRAFTIGSFFRGEDKDGRSASTWMLTLSIFISWIFAKSVTNAANLGAQYGIVGGVAYAVYWLCIPLAGLVIYGLRRRFGATGLVSFLTEKYGRAAAVAFSAAILIRLFNEVWSNTAVVGGYYGESGSRAFICAALLFTLVTVAYSVRGGLLSSIVTDALQALVFIVVMIYVVVAIIPQHSVGAIMTSGEWKLDAGVDLLFVSALQILSYPFHDPVLTDRGFICEEKPMLIAFFVSGILGFLAIVFFSTVGIHASLVGIKPSGNIPAELAKATGAGVTLLMTMVMVFAAGSTLDSTFSSLAKLAGQDIPQMMGRDLGRKSITVGMITMVVFAVIGNAPMVVGTDILKATTISGTMVIGLAPVFLLYGVVPSTKLGFHLSFWTGIILGFAYTLGWIPESWAIGGGDSALLLGVNLYGLLLCTAGFILPGLFRRGSRAARTEA